MTEYRNPSAVFPMGLNDSQVTESRNRHGENILSRKKGKSFLRSYLSNLNDPVIRILLGALAVNLLLLFRSGDWLETAGIGFAVFLATLISTLSERSSEKAFASLSGKTENDLCRVRRNNRTMEIRLSEIVVGDVVLLSQGEAVPADGKLFRGNLTVDQSSMTGETEEVRKRAGGDYQRFPECSCALFRGSTLLSGSGEMQVTAVGDETFLGEISREIQTEQQESPLKKRLAKLAKQISVLGYVAAVMVAFAYLFHVFLLDSGMRQEVILLKIKDTDYLISKLLHAFMLGLTVIVVAVPEGLPMMIAVVLSSNVKRMVKDSVLVRKPVGIESAGSMNILFTDKTGTLTEGKMQVTEILFPNGERYTRFADLKKERPALAEYVGLAFCTGESEFAIMPDGSKKSVGGNPTDRALRDWIGDEFLTDGYEKSDRLILDSNRKYAGVTYTRHGEKRSFLTGAPEKLLFGVQNQLEGEIEKHRFLRTRVQNQIRERTRSGNRVLSVVLSESGVTASEFENRIADSTVYLCTVCLSDPVRPEAKKAVEDLQGAGIHVVMITGDAPETAKQIASACGILSDTADTVLTGKELSALSDARLKELLPRLGVIARALPTDKSRLVRISQELGLVTGMTGDGINDAPALRRADVGFAMGSGTQVAKDAGDIIILDDNLASVVRAVLYGRTVFKSIRKFITLQLTMNFSAVGVTMISPFLGIDSPVTVIQMLWINLIMDTLGGLAFAGEAPLQEDMKKPPKRKEEGILNRYMVNEIAILGGFTVLLSLLFLKHPFLTSRFRPAKDQIYLLTGFFAFFIFASVFNCFNARTDRLKLTAGLQKNRIFLIIMTTILFIQLLFVYVGGTVLRTQPLLPGELLATLLASLFVFPCELLRKIIWRMRGKKRGY